MLRHQAGIVVLDAVPLPVAPAPVEIPQVNIAQLTAAVLFGQDDRPSTARTEISTTHPELVLRGIIVAAGRPSVALLDVEGVPGVYRPEMPVTEGLMVKRIGTDFVELQDSASVLTLWFDDLGTIGAPSPKPTDLPADALLARMAQEQVVPKRYERPGKPETTTEYIDYWRQRIRKNPQMVLDEIGLEPTDDGYVIAADHDVGVRLAGLRTGDLVRSVNGQAVGDPDQDRRFYDAIAASGFARLEVERSGQTLSFSFPLR